MLESYKVVADTADCPVVQHGTIKQTRSRNVSGTRILITMWMIL